MRIGVFASPRLSRSVELYSGRICAGLRERGCTLLPVHPGRPLPEEVDLYWDPSATGGRAPDRSFRHRRRPLVVTVHGMASRALPAREYYADRRSMVCGKLRQAAEWTKWRWWHDGGTIDVITVSHFAAAEIRRYLPVTVRRITPIYHGVDHGTFHPDACSTDSAPYLLHASFYQPLKNVGRIVSAFRTAEIAPTRLVMICPGLPPGDAVPVPGIEWSREAVDPGELAVLLRSARGFVFPSLRESFGLPLLEAMACGSPVVTSRVSACAEIAGDAALLVDPRSVGEIGAAMKGLATDADVRRELRRRGLERAASFSWGKSVDEHLAAFDRALARSPA